jgi:hypothetical protein
MTYSTGLDATAGVDISAVATSATTALAATATFIFISSCSHSQIYIKPQDGRHVCPLSGAGREVLGPVVTVLADALSHLLSALGFRASGAATSPHPRRRGQSAAQVLRTDSGAA